MRHSSLQKSTDQSLFRGVVASFVIIGSLLFSGSVLAQDEDLYTALDNSFTQLKNKFSTVQTQAYDADAIKAIHFSLSKKDTDAGNCIQAYETRLENASKLLPNPEALDDVDEAGENLKAIHNTIKQIEENLAGCRLIKIEIEQLLDEVASYRKQRMTDQLLDKSTSFIGALTDGGTPFSKVASASGARSGLEDLVQALKGWRGWVQLLISVAVGFVIGTFLMVAENHKHKRRSESNTDTLYSVKRGFSRTAPWLLAIFFGLAYLFARDQSPVILKQLALALGAMFLVFAAARGILRSSIINEDATRKPQLNVLRVLAWVLILLTTANYLLNTSPVDALPNQRVNYILWYLTLVGSVFTAIVLLNKLLKLARARVRLPWVALLSLGLMVPVIAGLLGYRSLAAFLLTGIYATTMIAIVASLLLKLSTELMDGLDSGASRWQQQIKSRLGVERDQVIPGMIWLRVLVFFGILAVSAYLWLLAWGVSTEELNTGASGFFSGFEIQGVRVEPMRLLIAILVIVLTFALLPLFKRLIGDNLLSRGRFRRGARDATQTLVGYVWVALGFLFALNVAGANFQNIAIIAGALSVGIGFGLQNIVNNFVSGLILLFERPIRRGDWVVVGNTEGYVRDISIRSTRIETFQRADVIVPNSEFIANQVTNWMLDDGYGQVRVPISASYDTDPQLVVRLLQDIATEHPEVIQDVPDFPIRAYFLSFGDSALEFELRCFLDNVDNRIRVLHELNLEIYRVFKEEGIEIPFPQRTLHWADKGQAVGSSEKS